ncbi:MAG: hypothetical protein RL148_373 [Planctomycetota bacterium]|jgi:asparagine synthase (glutamine-hydrolysing)
MCGIAGILHADRSRVVPESSLRAMADAIAHRGPDGEGFHLGPGFGLAHRRLAIVDLAGGNQPMSTADGRLHVVFNGEVYNHLSLRAELEAHGFVFRTRSDTEVLLHGWRHWGTGLAARLRGMFAFVVVDEASHELYAARDRLGKKPFHYVHEHGAFWFASELKALRAGGVVGTRIRPEAVAQFLSLRYVAEPGCVFEGVQKLAPAHWLHLRGDRIRVQRYWALSFASVSTQSPEQLHERALELLDEAVRIRLMGEVPLAPFLSGGIDSHAVVDSMRRQAGGTFRACTVGFDDPAFDERAGARESAAASGVELVEELLRPDELEDLGWFDDTFDEPFADSSALPTYHVCRLARRHVTVALSGDGGDESFAGYRRHLFDVRENRVRGLLPPVVWQLLGRLWPKGDWLPRPLRAKRTLQELGMSAARAYASSVSATLPEEVLAVLQADLVPLVGDPLAPVVEAHERSDAPDALGRACAADFATWLVSDILVKVDRASMATSLEVRSPFLDHELVEFAATVPSALKLAGGRTKAFLREALASRLPASTLTRRKQGFSVPLRRWMAGALGARLEAELGEPALAAWVDPSRARALLERHRAGVRDHSELLYAILVLGRFLRRWAS